MQKLSAYPEQSVVFEDSKNGSIAGLNAGCYVIGLRAGNIKQQDLSSANVVVGSFKDLGIL